MQIKRNSPINISGEEFRAAGHQLVDAIAEFLDNMDSLPVTPGESPEQLHQVLGNTSLPENGKDAAALLQHAAKLMFDHSLLNGHPKFMGYITGAGAPIGSLGDLLAAAVNPNVGANILSPMATAIEQQTVKWLVELIGLPACFGGLLVSGGNMANFTGFLAARTALAPKNIKEDGLRILSNDLVVYCSKSTHTWIEKAVVLFGHGLKSIRWVPTNGQNQMDLTILQTTIEEDIAAGRSPFMVVGTAGDVSTGAVDDFAGIAAICKQYDAWFHIDGAYGIPAAVLPEEKELFLGMVEADSIAMDPHKWLYSPLEAGCTLVKDPNLLTATYSSHPVYYNFDVDQKQTQNFYEYGFQNSRGFRALKVWLILQQAGRQGYIEMIREDIRLSRLLFDLAKKNPLLEAMTQHLSIATLRYVPAGLDADESTQVYLNQLNESLTNRLQQDGKIFLSNAVINGHYCLRSCIVNFRTSEADIIEIIDTIVAEGTKIDAALRGTREQTTGQ